MPSNSSSSPFPWLPPLNSHPNFAVYITAQQKQFQEDNYSTHSLYPEFLVDFHVKTKFYSEDQTKNDSIRGLNLRRRIFNSLCVNRGIPSPCKKPTSIPCSISWEYNFG
nr:hypothetical protein Itr_chr01CG05210 [Ipomoea trifida]GLL16784.1 hypothetical protein Itr_chr01CG05230 [Ipomoea trifida]